MSWFYYGGRVIVRIILFLFARWRVNGEENVPDSGSLLIVANHVNLADPPVIAVSVKRKAFFMAKEELFRSRFSRYFISGFGAFPVHRGKLDREALRSAKRVLEENKALIMFPEGMRSNSGQLRSAFSGSALIALRNNVTVLPVGISGTESIKGLGWLLRRPRITVNIGVPFNLPSVDGKLTRKQLAESTGIIMENIAELLPANYHGDYAEKRD